MLDPSHFLGLGVIFFSLLTHAQDWQEITDDQKRLAQPAQPEPEIKVIDEETVYAQGEGLLVGAFGLTFSEPLPVECIIHELGWTEVSELPANLVYKGPIQPFVLPAYIIKPPAIPDLLSSPEISFQVFLDFKNRPFWIIARSVPDIDKLLPLLERKYGEPEVKTRTEIRFDQKPNLIRIVRHGALATVHYVAVNSFRAYLKLRNASIRKKYNNPDKSSLNPEELKVMTLFDEFIELRQDFSGSFGLKFGRRVGFIAKPDKFVPFTPPRPMRGIDQGAYRVMVNPDLMPIAMRLELEGSPDYLAHQKLLIDLALDTAYGGFLKRTKKHTVLSLKGNSISVIVRNRQFILSVINNSENKKYIQRQDDIARAKREAELEEKRQIALNFRRKEIEQERGL